MPRLETSMPGLQKWGILSIRIEINSRLKIEICLIRNNEMT
jgi:hypothetical protein